MTTEEQEVLRESVDFESGGKGFYQSPYVKDAADEFNNYWLWQDSSKKVSDEGHDDYRTRAENQLLQENQTMCYCLEGSTCRDSNCLCVIRKRPCWHGCLCCSSYDDINNDNCSRDADYQTLRQRARKKKQKQARRRRQREKEKGKEKQNKEEKQDAAIGTTAAWRNQTTKTK